MKRLLLLAVVLLAAALVPMTSSAPAGAADDPFFKYVDQQWPTFYPLVKDDFRDTTMLSFSTAAGLTAETWTITDSLGTVIRSVEVDLQEGYSVEWDGRTDAGTMAKPGTYRIDIAVQRTPIGTMEGDNLNFTLTRNVTLMTDVVTRHKHEQWIPGDAGPYWDSKSVSGKCRALKLYHEAFLDCWGHGKASAAYAFYLPTVGEEPGAGPVKNLRVYFNGSVECCRPGKVTKKFTHPYKHIWKGVVTVSNWRAYRIYSFNATYTYQKRR